MNQLYNYFKSHKDVSLADILIYLCDKNENTEFIFELILKHCYFSKSHKDTFNGLKSDDITYILLFYNNISLVTKHIFIEANILMHVITYKIYEKSNLDVFYLIDYLLEKHHASNYIGSILSDIICGAINNECKTILKYIYIKNETYMCNLNYQKIINVCIQQKDVRFLVFINEKMLEQYKKTESQSESQSLSNDENFIIITKEQVRIAMINKNFKVLVKVIELYLDEYINLKMYFNEILNNFDYNEPNCLKILKFLNDENKQKLNKN